MEQLLLRAVEYAIFAVDLSGYITYVNPSAAMLGGDIGKPLGDVIDSPWQRAIEEAQSISRHEAIIDNRVFADVTSPMFRDDKVIGAAIVARDVTSHRIELRQRELTERDIAISGLVAALAHHVNNPLAVATVHAELLRDELIHMRDRHPQTGQRIDDMIATELEIQRALQTIAQIVADVRTFCNAAPGDRRTDLRRSIEWATRSASPILRDRARAVTTVELDGSVAIDEPSFGKVLAHLIANAAHAIAPGAAERNRIAITARAALHPGHATIEVRDTGRGIANERIGTLFQPALIARPDHTRIGLGLATCRDIIQGAGGTVEVASTIGLGTTVRVTLPLVQPRPPTGQRAKVLVVDDNAAYVRSLQRVLRNHDVSGCATANDALCEIGNGANFDLILADVELSGTELYRALLADHPGVARRVVFVAQTPTSSTIQDFLAETPNRWFEKPISPAELRTLVQGFVPRASTHGIGGGHISTSRMTY